MRGIVQSVVGAFAILARVPQFAQIDELDYHLALRAHPRGIVAVARHIQGEGGGWLELRAAVWRNRRIESHTQTVREHEVECLGVSAIAERFVELVQASFPQQEEARLDPTPVMYCSAQKDWST